MRKALGLVAVAVVAIACSRGDPQGLTEPSRSEVTMAQAPRGDGVAEVTEALRPHRNFRAHLRGREEVPPRDTPAQGEAVFGLRGNGGALDFKLTVANIRNVVAAHIHLGARGINGPIVAFLFGPAGPGGGRTDGVLVGGTITAADLIGPLAGHRLSALLAEMRAGNAYVNVHTDDGLDGANTGPGDFPGGEIRGQIF